ncbi:MAG: 2-C-methyl-D-erythritol 2,4-cyclodiphosphate synthase [Alphaproteobacteria bacterium 33-17]|nr:MAG: 2-C-methyl-D-erythritol 2,4-cyclodiphosphate synthase [Alphaproteobacteria bacterium 33-17]
MPANTCAIIVAGGKGIRFDPSLPKQYYKLGVSSIIEQTINKFAKLVNRIIVIVSPDDKYIDKYEFLPSVIVAKIGGQTRFDSSKNALKFIRENLPWCEKVLIHDACRPYVSEDLIRNSIHTLDNHEGVLPVVDLIDSLKQVQEGFVQSNLNREEFKLAQTPQSFIFSKIWSAYNKTQYSDFTDDVGVFASQGGKIKIIPGEKTNIKITSKDDIKIMSEMRVGFGIDVHSFEEGNGIMLGGIMVPCQYGVKAHSDGDVLLHSLCDAILGACGLGDIGVFFPPTEPEWKDMASKVFVKECINKMQEMGGQIVNIDLTLMAEIPKIKDVRDDIVANIAEICGISKEKVNLKGTTTEKLGFLGREEGVAANCVVMVNFINGAPIV